MSKVIKPDNIIFIGASLYMDTVQYGYLERQFPYITKAQIIERYPTYTKDIVNNLIELIKKLKRDTVIFTLDRYCNKLNKELQKLELDTTTKEHGTIYQIDDSVVIVKRVSLFHKLPTPIFTKSRNIASFKAFGNEMDLLSLEEKLANHAVVTRVLPSWYNIDINDNIGEKILVENTNKLDIKLLPIKSVRKALIEYLSSKGKTISFAESCTGGKIVAKFIEKDGASSVIAGSMVAYSNEIKTKWLGVEESILNIYGAVSKECVSQMLDGIQEQTNSDIAIAVSGIAGPSGETETKKVGDVFIGIKNGDTKEIIEFNFQGDRAFIQEQAIRRAIEMILNSEKEFFDFF
jgi:nicotinamide-nucleotide amidase